MLPKPLKPTKAIQRNLEKNLPKPNPKLRVKPKTPLPKTKVIITKKIKALNRAVKALQVAIIKRKDPAKQLYYTNTDVAKVLKNIFNSKWCI